jgi:soluble lytic murein transglycosylase-like protein
MAQRRVIGMFALAVAIVVGLLVLVYSLTGGPTKAVRLVPRGAIEADPLAFSEGKAGAFERAAALGLSQVIYAKSPGGVLATARRTAAYRPLIEQATDGTEIDPDVVEGIILLESGGRPDAIAGSDVANAAGLTQILAETGSNFLGMRIDLARSRRLTVAIAAADARGDPRGAARLRARRRRVDARFDPARAIAGTVRYLSTAQSTFGRTDLAVVSYHMGIGNLDHVLRSYAQPPASESIRDVVERVGLTWAQV